MLRLNKRAISPIIAYVLLITIAISISGMVFYWLEFFVSEDTMQQCPDGISISIQNYTCDSDNTELFIEVKNRGRFSIEGFLVRIHTRVDAEQAIYLINSTGVSLSPQSKSEYEYGYSNIISLDGTVLRTNNEDPTFLEIQPYVIEEGNRVYCSAIAKQEIIC